jgi:endonuclease III
MTPSRRDGSDPRATARAVLDRFDRTYVDDAGIDVKDRPANLFQLLCFAALSSARIRANIAAEAARALSDQGWTTPEKLARSRWEDRARVLNQAGYARYDERTATMLADSAETLLDRWDGDLRRLRDEAGRDPRAERRLLQQLKGIGPVGAEIFAREAQAVWPELHPTADKRALQAAERLGLGDDPEALARLVDRRDFPRLVDNLVRIALEDAYDDVSS